MKFHVYELPMEAISMMISVNKADAYWEDDLGSFMHIIICMYEM